MSANDDQREIDLISRAIITLGWNILITDRSGITLKITIERPRTTTPPLTTPTPTPGAQ